MKINAKFFYIYSLVVTCVLAYSVINNYKGKGQDLGASLLQGSTNRLAKSYDINKNFDFAGERIPMENFDARERLDREVLINAYMQSSTIMNIKLANRYFPTVEQLLQQEGVPDDFKYLAVAESSLRNLTSAAGAKGFWQFMGPTGRQYGLQIDDEVDERYNLEKSTHAACVYLKDMYRQYNNWLLVAAGYNMGAPRLSREMAEQRATNYYEVNLNEETSRYVSRIMAIKEIMQHPTDYDFVVQPDHLYATMPAYTTTTVNFAVPNWGDFARKYGTNYRMLKLYNPWIMGVGLTNKTGKSYEVRLPQQ